MRLEEVIRQNYPCHCGTWGWDGRNLLVIIQGRIVAVPPTTRYYEIPILRDPSVLWFEEHDPTEYVPIETLSFRVPLKNWKPGPLTLFEGLYD